MWWRWRTILTLQFKIPFFPSLFWGHATQWATEKTGSEWQGGVECETSSPHQLRIARGHFSFCFLQWPSGRGWAGAGALLGEISKNAPGFFRRGLFLFCECFPIWVLVFFWVFVTLCFRAFLCSCFLFFLASWLFLGSMLQLLLWLSWCLGFCSFCRCCGFCGFWLLRPSVFFVWLGGFCSFLAFGVFYFWVNMHAFVNFVF